MEENGTQPPANNPSNLPPEQINDEKDKGDKGQPAQPVDKQSEAYRQQQSRADKSQSEVESLREDVNFLTDMAYKQFQEETVGNFIKDFGQQYPNVTADDLKRFSRSPDDLEDTAKYLQSKHDEIKNQTLADAREVPVETMTEKEKEDAKAQIKPSSKSFGEWLRIQSTRTRK